MSVCESRCRTDVFKSLLCRSHTALGRIGRPPGAYETAAAQRHSVGNTMEPDSPTRSLTSLHTNDLLDSLLDWDFPERERHQAELPNSNPEASQGACTVGVGEGIVEAPQEATLAVGSSHCTEPAIELAQRRPKRLPRANRRQKQNRQAQDRLRQRQKVV